MKHALEKEGWTITHNQMPIKIGTIQMYVYLSAERIITANKEEVKYGFMAVQFMYRLKKVKSGFNTIVQKLKLLKN